MKLPWILTAAVVAVVTGCGPDGSKLAGPTDDTPGEPTADLAFADSALAERVSRALLAVDGDPEALTSLGASEIGLQSLDGIERLVGLDALDLSVNGVVDLRPLAPLTHLRLLDLSFNRIADLAALAGLDSLRFLNLAGNAITDIGPLLQLDAIEEIDLTGNPLGQVAVDEHIPVLRARGIVVRTDEPESEAQNGQPAAVASSPPEDLVRWDDLGVFGAHSLAVDDFGALYAGTLAEDASTGAPRPELVVSRDRGRTWTTVIDTFPAFSQGPVDVVHVVPETAGQLIIAHFANGFARSDDAGRSWDWLFSHSSGSARYVPVLRDDIVPSPLEPLVFYLATLAPALRVMRSPDGGQTLRTVREGLTAVAMDGTGIVYTTDRRRVYRSGDGGTTLEELPYGGPVVLSLGATRDGSGQLYAGTTGGVYQYVETDGAWSIVLDAGDGGWTSAQVHVDPRDARRLLVIAAPLPASAREEGLSVGERIDRTLSDLDPRLQVTTDRGATWTEVDVPGFVRDVCFDTRSEGRTYVATSVGVFEFVP